MKSRYITSTVTFLSLVVWISVSHTYAASKNDRILPTNPNSPSDSTWNEIIASPSPSPRTGIAFAFDSTLLRAVLFGGGQSGYSFYGDTWIYKANDWHQVITAHAPSPRWYPSMVYDPIHERMIMFGGWNNGGTGWETQETWEFNNIDWTQITPANSPSERAIHGMVYRNANNHVILFGGWGPGALNDTWEYDGTNWTKITTTHNPPARYDFSIAYDSDRDRVIIFGGCTDWACGPRLGDTWEFDGNDWYEVNTPVSPGQRSGAAMGYDSTYRKVVLFGGCSTSQGFGDCLNMHGDTWKYDGTSWAPIGSTSNPPSRFDSSITYDTSSQKAVLFGGRSTSGSFLGDTWEYSGTPSTGLRPNPDGYNFTNWGVDHFNTLSFDFSLYDLRRMFGDEVVCRTTQPQCVINRSTRQWWLRQLSLLYEGHCEGMVVTSERFYSGLDKPSDLDSSATYTHDLSKAISRRHISYFHILQNTPEVLQARHTAEQKTPNEVLIEIRAGLTSNNLLALHIFSKMEDDQISGHALVPYSAEDQGNGLWFVMVYDPNYPNDESRYVVFNTGANSWVYNHGGSLGIWVGNASTKTISVIPISVYNPQQTGKCPWCTQSSGAVAVSQTWLEGEGHLLFTNSQNQRLGYVGNQYIDEIIGGYGTAQIGGIGESTEPLYTLPITDTYTIQLNGHTITEAQTVSLAQFGPGYSVSIDRIDLQPVSENELQILQEGNTLQYTSSLNDEILLQVTSENQDKSYQFDINGADLGVGQTITMTLNQQAGKLILDNSGTNGGLYDLSLVRVDNSGEKLFSHFAIQVNSTDTHVYNYGAWDGSGSIILEIDHGSDGSIDETLIFSNQSNRVFVPLIQRNQ